MSGTANSEDRAPNDVVLLETVAGESRFSPVAVLLVAAVAATLAPLLPAQAPIGVLRVLLGLAGGLLGPAYGLLLVVDPLPTTAPRRAPLAAGSMALLGALGGLAVLAGILDVLGLPLQPFVIGPLISTVLVATAVWLVRHPAFLERTRMRRRVLRRSLRQRRVAGMGAASIVAAVIVLPPLAATLVTLVPASPPYSALSWGGDLARLTGPQIVPDGQLWLTVVRRSRTGDAAPLRLEVRLDGRATATPSLSEPSPAEPDGDPGSAQAEREAPLLEQVASFVVTVPRGACLHRISVTPGDGYGVSSDDGTAPRLVVYAARQQVPAGVTCAAS